MQILKILPALFLVVACGKQDNDEIRVEGAWIAEIPPVLSVTAALMILHNDGDRPKYLTGVTSPKAETIEIHRSIVVNDLAKMVRQDQIEIPAKGRFEFSNETGYHLMFYGTGGISKGQKIPVSLHFRDGTVLEVIYEVLDRRDRV